MMRPMIRRALWILFPVLPGLANPANAQEDPAQPAQQWRSANQSAGGVFAARSQRTAAEREAITEGLKWLAEHRVDGHWIGADAEDQRTAVLVTGVAMLAMLGDGNTMRSGPHKDPLKTAVVWYRDLLNANDTFLPKDRDDAVVHAIATTALGEAFLLSNYKLLQPHFARSIVPMQQRRLPSGAFAAAGQRADVLLSLWSQLGQMTAEYSGVSAPVAKDGLAAWLASDEAARLPERSLLPTIAMPGADLELRHEQTAARLLLTCFVEDTPGKPDAAATDAVRDRPRKWNKGVSLHEWFCASHLLHQVGTAEHVDKVLAPLLAGQVREGPNAGSWDPIDLCGEAGGRAWSTAMAVMTLQARQRYAKVEKR